MDECCIACLSDNRSSFAGLNEKESVEEFLSAKLPPVFANYPVILCSGCMFQLEKFRNFRQFVQNSISTLTIQLNKIYSCRVFVEPISVFLEATPNTIKEENVDSPEYDNDDTHHQNEDSDDEMESGPADSVSSFDDNEIEKCEVSTKVRERKETNNRLQKEKHQESNEEENESNESLLEGEPNLDTSIKMEALVDYGSSLDKWDAITDASDNVTQKKGTKKDYFVKRPGSKAAKWNNYIKKHNKRFFSKSSWKHGEREKCSLFQCDHCPYTAKKKYNMREHVKLHFNIKDFKCHICNQCYTTQRKLRDHLMAHLSPRECDFCSKTFMSKSGLNNHVQSKHTNEQFFCDECDKSFSSKKALSKHKKVHSKTMDFVCNVCPAMFRWRRTLIRHLEVHERHKEIDMMKD